MSRPRWRKVLRDLWLHLPRTLLVILAITLGIFGVGAFLDAYAIITPTIDTNFTMTNPAAVTVQMEGADVKEYPTPERKTTSCLSSGEKNWQFFSPLLKQLVKRGFFLLTNEYNIRTYFVKLYSCVCNLSITITSKNTIMTHSLTCASFMG